MGFDELLQQSPVKWTDARMQALHSALFMQIPMPDDIVAVNQQAGISPGNLPLGGTATGRVVWRASINYAGSQLKLPDLVAQAEAWSPALAARVAELRSEVPPLPATSTAAPQVGDYNNFSAKATKERLMVANDPTLLDVNFLALGVERAKSICRIEAWFDGAISTGTGFRIGPNEVLTNHHVVFDEEHGNARAKSVQAKFKYELGIDGEPLDAQIVNGVASTLRGGSPQDDWAVVSFDDPLPDDAPALSIDGPTTPVRVDDRVVIIQHPGGMPKKVALSHNLVRFANDDVIQYWTDTEEGSSGSPVFNERWEVVALHHASVDLGDTPPEKDQYGFRNQGLQIARVRAMIAAG